MEKKMIHTHVYEEFGSLLTLKGSFNVGEIVILHTQIYNHPNLENSNYFIVDGSEALVTEETLDVPLVINEVDRAFAKYKIKMNALFVSTDSEFIDLYTKYKNNLKDLGWNFKLFKSLKDARKYQKKLV